MCNKSGSVIVTMFLIYNCALVNLVIANTIPTMEIDVLPDLYALASTYPASSVNYNASPNPQYTSNHFNNFNEPTATPTPTPPPPPPPNSIVRSYENGDYSQKPQQSVEQSLTGSYSPETNIYEYGSDIKNTLVSVNDNLGLMADTQRLLLNAFKVQQDQYQDIERKLQYNEPPAYSQRNYAPPAPQQPVQYQPIPGPAPQQPVQYQPIPGPVPQQPVQYQPIPAPAPQQPVQYQPISALPPLPYAQPIIPTSTPAPTVHHHKKSLKKSLGKVIRQQRRKLAQRRLTVVGRGLGRESDAIRLERRADLALSFIKNGILNALWTALVVACVKLAPLLLFGFKLMFQSVVPLTGLALFRNNRGLFQNHETSLQNHIRDVRDNLDDNKFQFEDEDQDEDEDDLEDEERDISEENDDDKLTTNT